MYFAAKIKPIQPSGVIIDLKTATLIINPNATKEAEEAIKKGKLTYILTTNREHLQKIIHNAETIRIATPPITTDERVLVYPAEKPIIIEKNTKAYFLNPPQIVAGLEDYYIYIKTKHLEILYAPRPTKINRPPHVDIIITTQKTIQTINKITTNQNEIPKYLGADPQHIIVISSKNKQQDPYIYIKNKEITIIRHLTTTIIKI